MFNGEQTSVYEIVTADDLADYMFGGSAVLTLKSPSGKHRVYKIYGPRNDDFPEGTYFIDAQTSSGNWMYVGMIDPEKGFRRTTHSRYSRDHEIFKGALYLYEMSIGKYSDTPMTVFHNGVCSVCGRRLTHPDSLLRGMGPKCRRKSRAQKRQLRLQTLGRDIQ